MAPLRSRPRTFAESGFASARARPRTSSRWKPRRRSSCIKRGRPNGAAPVSTVTLSACSVGRLRGRRVTNVVVIIAAIVVVVVAATFIAVVVITIAIISVIIVVIVVVVIASSTIIITCARRECINLVAMRSFLSRRRAHGARECRLMV